MSDIPDLARNGAVNPDLVRERRKASFEVEQLSLVLHGTELATQRYLETLIKEDKDIANEPVYHFLSREEKYAEAIRKSAIFIKLVDKYKLDPKHYHTLRQILLPNEEAPFGLHIGMFMPTLEVMGTEEQKEKWLQKAKNFEIIGTYAQTELGHGTNVRQLETTAVYDPETEEFILNSPTITSTKFWPGALGKTSNFAVVMAGLYTLGKFHGIHSFVVQLRDLETHLPLPGITLGDIGPKFGYESQDNGFLRFNHLRIPRQNMLSKNAEVQKDGRFVKTGKDDRVLYMTMMLVRSHIVHNISAEGLAQAATIAIRYSCVRHQSELKPGADEPQILDYQLQQYKLFPLLASAYAFWFTGRRIAEMINEVKNEVMRGNVESLQELHATSAGLKAFTTSVAVKGIEVCRMACGGHGYSNASGFSKIYVTCTPACTYEGENTVMLLQTSRYLAKSYQEAQSGKKLKSSVSYLSEKWELRRPKGSVSSVEFLVDAYKYRAASLVARACRRLKQLQSGGMPQYEAWNKSSIGLVKAAEAHCDMIVVQEFINSVEKQKNNPSIHAVLTDLFKLYATHGIRNNAVDFLEGGYITSDQLGALEDSFVILLDAIRPNAVALVDAFAFSDRLLGSVLGRYDGQVYDNLYQWAANSPLNKTQVHSSFQHLKELRTRSKL